MPPKSKKLHFLIFFFTTKIEIDRNKIDRSEEQVYITIHCFHCSVLFDSFFLYFSYIYTYLCIVFKIYLRNRGNYGYIYNNVYTIDIKHHVELFKTCYGNGTRYYTTK